ncbi:MAG TPA: DUF2062 domain-containing protein [Acidisarcina sp.]|nr:DUF2062 domain-containing protein [Acidisarcina sp.]
MRSFFYNKFAAPLAALVQQGATPDMLAHSLAIGICVSCFPVPGTTTLLCSILAVAFRLNLPAILLANWAALPLQVLLLVPLISLGEKLFHSEHLSLDPGRLSGMLQTQPLQMTRQLWTWEWHAAVAWMLTAPLAWLLLAYGLRIPLSRLAAFSPRLATKEIDPA